jgi:low affinity Fe/Cu permease
MVDPGKTISKIDELFRWLAENKDKLVDGDHEKVEEIDALVDKAIEELEELEKNQRNKNTDVGNR